MFLNYIKDFYAKKKLKNGLHELNSTVLSVEINKVGLLIDETNFTHKDALIQELSANGIKLENIHVLSYKDRFSGNENGKKDSLGLKDLTFAGELTSRAAIEFMNQEFDLLLSYYQVEKALLMLVTNNSKANFKVGFSTIDKRLNHLMINTTTDNYKLFTDELFKYLKLFKQNTFQ